MAYGRNRIESLDTTLLRIEMIKRGWNAQDLAERCRLSASLIRHELLYGFPHKRTQLKVETAIGRPIWSTTRQWNRRKQMAAALGFDPYLSKITSLSVWAKDHGISYCVGRKKFTKEELIQKIARQILQPTNQAK